MTLAEQPVEQGYYIGKTSMAKRFTCTDKWKREYFKAFEQNYKLLWLYILDDCDTAGTWVCDFEVASMRIGFDFKKEEVIKMFEKKIKIINDERWFIPEFLATQYKNAKTDSNFHKSIKDRLQSYGLNGYTDYDDEMPY